MNQRIKQLTVLFLGLSIDEIRTFQSVIDGIVQFKSNNRTQIDYSKQYADAGRLGADPEALRKFRKHISGEDFNPYGGGLDSFDLLGSIRPGTTVTTRQIRKENETPADLSNGKMNDGRDPNEEINRVALSQFDAFYRAIPTSNFSGKKMFTEVKREVIERLADLDRPGDPHYAGFLAYYFLAARWRRSTESGRNYSLNRFIGFASSRITPQDIFGIWPDQRGGSVTPGIVALLPIVLGILRCDYKDSPRPNETVVEAIENLKRWDDLRPGYTLGEMYAIACGESLCGEEFDLDLAAQVNTDFFKAFPYDLEGKA